MLKRIVRGFGFLSHAMAGLCIPYTERSLRIDDDAIGSKPGRDGIMIISPLAGITVSLEKNCLVVWAEILISPEYYPLMVPSIYCRGASVPGLKDIIDRAYPLWVSTPILK